MKAVEHNATPPAGQPAPRGIHLRGVPWWVGPLVALAGVACMAVGVWRGEAVVVLRKAVAICLECIGIG